MEKNKEGVFLLIALIFVVWSPFLVCDVQPEATYYVVVLDHGPGRSTPAPLHYDLAGIAYGWHMVEVHACNDAGCSQPASLRFNKSAPADVSGVTIGR